MPVYQHPSREQLHTSELKIVHALRMTLNNLNIFIPRSLQALMFWKQALLHEVLNLDHNRKQ